MQISKTVFRSSLMFSGALLILIGITAVASVTHAATSYKQAFSSGNTSMSAIFNVAGDENSVSYTLNGVLSGSLSCTSNSGSMVDVADLSSMSGTVGSSNILSAAMTCNPAINTTAHLIQDMREGKIFFVSGGVSLPLSAASISNVPPSITTGTTGGIGSTTPVMTGGTSTSTMATSTASTTTSTISASDLRVALNVLLREHVSASIDVLRNISDNSPALTASLARQDANAVDLANAIASVYGTAAGNTFLTEFRAHIADSNAYTEGVKDGSVTNQTAALAALDMQLQNLATFFSTANPYIDNAGLLAALRQHEVLVNDASVSYNQGNYTDSYTYEEQALEQISGGADVLANAIVQQYPTVFTK